MQTLASDSEYTNARAREQIDKKSLVCLKKKNRKLLLLLSAINSLSYFGSERMRKEKLSKVNFGMMCIQSPPTSIFGLWPLSCLLLWNNNSD